MLIDAIGPYINPFNHTLNSSKNFSELDFFPKVAVIAAAVFGSVCFLGIGGIIGFRVCTNLFYKKQPANVGKVGCIAVKVLPHTLQKHPLQTGYSSPRTPSQEEKSAKKSTSSFDPVGLDYSSESEASSCGDEMDLYDSPVEDTSFIFDSEQEEEEEEFDKYIVSFNNTELNLNKSYDPYIYELSEQELLLEDNAEVQIGPECDIIDQKLQAFSLHRVHSQDNGDCFYDSLAQIFTHYSKKACTTQDVRTFIKSYIDYMNAIDKNWIKEFYGSDDVIPYEEYEKQVGYDYLQVLEYNNGKGREVQKRYNEIIALLRQARSQAREMLDQTDSETFSIECHKLYKEIHDLSHSLPKEPTQIYPVWGGDIDLRIISSFLPHVAITVHNIQDVDRKKEYKYIAHLYPQPDLRIPTFENIRKKEEEIQPVSKKHVSSLQIPEWLTLFPKEGQIHLSLVRQHYEPCLPIPLDPKS